MSDSNIRSTPIPHRALSELELMIWASAYAARQPSPIDARAKGKALQHAANAIWAFRNIPAEPTELEIVELYLQVCNHRLHHSF